jgi:hypothetical protein
MKNQEEINEEVEKTLRVLEGIEVASPKPFFYTRLKARMESQQQYIPQQVRWVLKPTFVFGTLAIVLLLNVVSAVNYSKKTTQVSSNSQTLEGFAKEYGLGEN